MTIEHLKEQCEQWLQAQWQGVYTTQRGVFVVPGLGRTVCMVEVEQIRGGPSRVNVRAPVLQNVTATPALYEYVATNGGNFLFGAVSLYSEHGPSPVTIEFDYSLHGDSVTAAVLNHFVALVGQSAMQLIEQLQPVVGGEPVA